MLSRRITSAAPDMDLLNDKECITRLKKCCTKLVKRDIVTGIDKYVTESMQTKEEEHRALGKPIAKARPHMTPEGHSSFLARWHDDYKYRKSFLDIEWTEQDIMLFDRIASENHSYVATRAERIRNSEHWILKLNQDGAQQPLNQRPAFAQAKRERGIYGKDPAGI